MNKSFAVNPDLKFQANDLYNLFGKFGIENARYIGGLPKDWLQRVRLSLQDLSEEEKSRCMILLDKHRDSVRGLHLQNDKFESWLDSANQAKRKNRVEEIITDYSSDNTINYEDFIFDDDRYPKEHTYWLPAVTGSYIEAFRPLIEMSEELFLAARFFHLSWYKPKSSKPMVDYKNQEFLSELLKTMDRQPRNKRLILFFERNRELLEQQQEADIFHDLRTVIKKAGVRQVKVSFRILEKLTHWRYFFSIKGGVRVDQGIFIKDGRTAEFTFLSAKNIKGIFEDYEPYIATASESG